MLERLKLVLAKMAPFGSLSEEALTALASRCRFVRFDRHRQIVGGEEVPTDVFFIVSGTVRLATHSPAGRETAYGDLGGGDMLGDLAAIDGGRQCASATALTDTLVVAMPRRAFRAALAEHPPVAEAVLESLARRVRLYSQRLYELENLDVPARVHAELLRMAEDRISENNTVRIEPAPTHAAIASRIGTRREGVSRELASLARSGVVERDGGALEIRDLARLAGMVGRVRGERPRAARASTRRASGPRMGVRREGAHPGTHVSRPTSSLGPVRQRPRDRRPIDELS